MNIRTLYIILNQDRYRYYSYHKYTTEHDQIVCFYDAGGRLPDKEDIADGVEIFGSSDNLNVDYVAEQLDDRISAFNNVRVVCTEEKYFILAAKLRELYGADGMNLETSRFFRDKLIMKSKIRKIGFHSPVYCPFNSEQGYQGIVSQLGSEDFIVKPIDGYGARSTFRVRSKNEFDQLDIEYPEEYQAEEFINGHLYHIDSVMVNGEVIYSLPFEYSYPCFEYKNGKVISSIELDEESPLFQRLIEYNRKLLESIGGSHVTHLEVFVKDGDIVFLEIAGRPPGGGLVPLHRTTRGVDLAEIAVRFQMEPGFMPKIQQKRFKYGTFFMVPKPAMGTIQKIHEPPLKSDIDISYIGLKVGDRSQVADSVSQNGAFYLVSSDHAEHVRADFQMFKTHIMFS